MNAGATTETVEKTLVLVGNPNSGKTSLFNALTGLRAKTANYPGITVDLREAKISLGAKTDSAMPKREIKLVDLPGIYGLDATSPEEEVASAVVRGQKQIKPHAMLIVVDATNLSRSLFLVSELLELQLPAVVALSLIDEAESAHIEIDVVKLQEQLGCKVVPVSARTGQGIDRLQNAIRELWDAEDKGRESSPGCALACRGCSYSVRHDWANSLTQLSVRDPRPSEASLSRIDRLLTSPIAGLAALASVMLLVFFLIFSLADIPMSLIEDGFSALARRVGNALPSQPIPLALWWPMAATMAMTVLAAVFYVGGFRWNLRNSIIAVGASVLIGFLPLEDFRSLLLDGIIAGVAGVVVFLPQICILFFFITLLEDSGYLARGAFVMERVMRCVGLPGKAFVPMLSAHACAIPGIMATRTIENWRDRLVTILVLPLLTCSARLPVYAMVAALLFGDSAWKAAVMFAAAYLLGISAAFATAWILKRTIVPGEASPLVIELPPYRFPSLRNAWSTVIDRAGVFLSNAGTVILIISVILWALATYPKLPHSTEPTAESIPNLPGEHIVAPNLPQSTGLNSETISTADADEPQGNFEAQQALEYSFAGRLGRVFEPVFAPIGFDWKINVGVISSFAAREVVVSTLSIIYGLGEEGADDRTGLVETLRRQKRPDGSPVFDTRTCASLLVFYVLAMQCLPTQAVTRRETGSWKWAVFQLVYMTGLAYVGSLIVYQAVGLFTTQ